MDDAFLDADQLRTATFVRHVEIHDTLGSTNVRAAELARETNIELPALVVARRQTAGKGRGKNTWWSADGALTFSLLLDPAAFGIKTAHWPQLSLAAAVAVCDALSSELNKPDQRAGASPTPAGLEDEPARYDGKFQLGIKWPNDVVLDGRKVSGILIESPGGAAPAKNHLIIGVGINVNNSWTGAPPTAGAAGTALCDVTAAPHDLQSVLIVAVQSMKRRFHQLANFDPRLPQTWAKLNALTERRVEIRSSNGRAISGTCLGIADDGALIVNRGKNTERIYSGSVHEH